MINARSMRTVCLCIGILLSAVLVAGFLLKATGPSARQAKLEELSTVLQNDYNLRLSTNAVLLNYARKRRRSINAYYKLQMPENEWRSFWDQIVEQSGGILRLELSTPDGIDLPWWSAAPGATVHFVKRNRSAPLGTVMLYLVEDKPRYYILIERVD